MSSSVPVCFNGIECYVTVVEKSGGLRVQFDEDEWRGLRLEVGRRIPVRLGGDDQWLYVAAATAVPPTVWVELKAKYAGPALAVAESRKKPPPVVRFTAVARDTTPPAVAASDTHARLLAVGREWLEKYKPKSRYAVFLNDEGDGIPMGQVTIRPGGGDAA